MKKFIEEFKNFDNMIYTVMKVGIKFCFIICLFATLFLAIYESIYTPALFYIGIKLFQAGLFFIITFIIMRMYI